MVVEVVAAELGSQLVAVQHNCVLGNIRAESDFVDALLDVEGVVFHVVSTFGGEVGDCQSVDQLNDRVEPDVGSLSENLQFDRCLEPRHEEVAGEFFRHWEVFSID